MSATGTGAAAIDRLAIRRAHVTLLVPHEHPEPERVRARFDAVAERELGPALARALGAALAGTRPGVWLVRRLDVAFEAAADWDSDAITGAWAVAAARELEARVASGHGDDVQWFPDHAALTARFATDLAAGRAWNRWAYERFAGLRALPTSAALRTAINERAAPGAVLAAIDPAALAGVVAALTANDAGRVLAALAAAPADGEPWMPLARALTHELGAGPLDGEAHLALRLSARAGGSGEALVEAAWALARLAARVDAAPTDAARALLAGVRAGRLDAGAEALAQAGAEARAAIADALAARAGTGPTTGAAPAVPGVRHTTSGGAFLLLPLLAELPLEEGTANWPVCEDTSAAAMLRLLVLAQALGGTRAPLVWGDPVLRDVAGLGPRAHAGALASWAAAIPASALDDATTALVAWGRWAGALGGETLVLARAPLGVGRRLVLLDGARGQWLALGALGRGGPRRAATWLARARAPLAGAPLPGLLVDEGLGGAAAPDSWAWVRPLAEAERAAVETSTASVADVCARLPALADDLAHLALPRAWRLPGPLASAIALWSQALLRAFAWRIPGFSQASLPYLHANFLDVRASVEEEPGRRVVRIGRAPLHLMLGPSGMARASYRLRWGDDRPYALFPAS